MRRYARNEARVCIYSLINPSLCVNNLYKKYRYLEDSALRDLVDNGQIEAGIYIETLSGNVAMVECDKIIPDDAFQALTRSSDRGCPIAQYNLAAYLMRTNGQDEKVLSLLGISAKAGLLEAHLRLGRLYVSHLKGISINTQVTSMKLFVGMYEPLSEATQKRSIVFSWFYCKGHGTHKNLVKAFYYASKSADQDNEYAIDLQGQMFMQGYGCEVDQVKAFDCYTRAAEMGNNAAMHNVSGCYILGKGVVKDRVKAFYWTKRAGEGGLVVSMKALAYMYRYGLGCEKDFEEALKCYEKYEMNTRGSPENEEAMMKILKLKRIGNEIKPAYSLVSDAVEEASSGDNIAYVQSIESISLVAEHDAEDMAEHIPPVGAEEKTHQIAPVEGIESSSLIAEHDAAEKTQNIPTSIKATELVVDEPESDDDECDLHEARKSRSEFRKVFWTLWIMAFIWTVVIWTNKE
jgi:TPR repeat protein